jgi:hypothetical protein
MDFRLYGRVLWRFRALVGAGLVLAVLLGALTVVKLPSLAPRTPYVYAGRATLLVTQPGFPWGSALQQYEQPARGQGAVPSGDLTRLTALTGLYVQLVNGDAIAKKVAQRVPGGGVSATQNFAISPSYYSTALPILTLTGTGWTRSEALAATQAGVDVLTGYLKRQQGAADIAAQDRVVVEELQRPIKTTVVNGTKKTLPIVVFLTVMLAVIGLAFVLENLRPRPSLAAIEPTSPEQVVRTPARRSA